MQLHKKYIQRLFNTYYVELCKKSYQYVQDEDTSKDIVQEVFVKLLEKKRIDHILNIKSYLYKAVINESLKQLKKQQKLQTFNPELDSFLFSENSIERTTIQDELDVQLMAELNQLPKKCKEVFILCVLEGVKYKDAAETLGISTNTIKTQVKKAYKILRKSITPEEYFFFMFFKK